MVHQLSLLGGLRDEVLQDFAILHLLTLSWESTWLNVKLGRERRRHIGPLSTSRWQNSLFGTHNVQGNQRVHKIASDSIRADRVVQKAPRRLFLQLTRAFPSTTSLKKALPRLEARNPLSASFTWAWIFVWGVPTLWYLEPYINSERPPRLYAIRIDRLSAGYQESLRKAKRRDVMWTGCIW